MILPDLDARVREYAAERGGISDDEAMRELASSYLQLIDTIRDGGTGIAAAALNAAAARDEPWPPPGLLDMP